ncbi:hypothetical protein CA234_15065 [Sphingomonas sp. ABOLE]|nr:hypothetical protein CA234_15065 [Sphingomonas sp. ABOLE]
MRPIMSNVIGKLAPIALMSAIMVVTPAAAQSLHETHARVWMPAGKSQIVTWRMKDHKPAATQAHHQAGKHPYLPTRRAATDEAGRGTAGTRH